MEEEFGVCSWVLDGVCQSADKEQKVKFSNLKEKSYIWTFQTHNLVFVGGEESKDQGREREIRQSGVSRGAGNISTTYWTLKGDPSLMTPLTL